MNQYIYVRPRDDGQGWAVDVYDGRRAWAKTHLGEQPLNKAGAHRVAHKLRDPRTKRAVNSGGASRQPILGEVPTEFFEGEWHFPKADGPKPWAVITYADEPSPETGDVGWCWWALGMAGDAPTYEDAKRKAETWIQARINGMPASGRWA